MANSLDSIILPAQLIWKNEFTHAQISQAATRTLGGGLILSESRLLAGRSIILQATSDQGWFFKSQVEALKTLADSIGISMVLTLNTQVFTVTFDHAKGPAVQFTPLVFRMNSGAGDFFMGTLKLLTLN